MQYKITIPEPCSQNWQDMQPDATGRFCNSCQKSVVDFTLMADEDIQQYFIQQQGLPVCGRFKKSQIHRIIIDLPENIFHIKMPLWMRVMVACLIIFGMSIFPFETTVAGKVLSETSIYQGEPITVKTGKKARKLKRKKKKILKVEDFVPFEFHDVVYGGAWGEPTSTIKIFSPMDVPNNTCTIQIYAIEHLTDKKSIPEKKHPGPTPYMPTEFILPSILLFRRKNNSNTMD